MRNETCYWCSAAATSREHAPPKCLFPEKKDTLDGASYRDDPITVPSCDLHNLAKSKEDAYILCILGMNILNNPVGNQQGVTKVVRAIQKSGGLAKLVLGEHAAAQVEDIQTGKVKPTIAVKLDDSRISLAFEHISRALYFHHFKQAWTGSVQCTPEFALNENAEINLSYDDLRIAADMMFGTAPKHGSNPDVFFYQVVEDPNTAEQLTLRLTFYGGTRVSVVFWHPATATNRGT